MFDKKHEGTIQSFLMSVTMCFFMSFIMTAVHLGIKDHYLLSCLKAFLHGLYIAIPTGLIMGPIIHKLTMKLVK